MQITITDEILETYFRNINNSQAKLLGVSRKRGWRKKLIGKRISKAILQECLDVKGLTPKQRENRVNKKLNIQTNKQEPSKGAKTGIFMVENFTERKKIDLEDISGFYYKANGCRRDKKNIVSLTKLTATYNRKLKSKSCDYSSFVYMIKDDSRYKIGKSNDVQRRLKSLQTGASSKLEIVKTIKVRYSLDIERMMHAIFSGCRITGEWFNMSDGQVLMAIKCLNRFDESDILIKRHE